MKFVNGRKDVIHGWKECWFVPLRRCVSVIVECREGMDGIWNGWLDEIKE